MHIAELIRAEQKSQNAQKLIFASWLDVLSISHSMNFLVCVEKKLKHNEMRPQIAARGTSFIN